MSTITQLAPICHDCGTKLHEGQLVKELFGSRLCEGCAQQRVAAALESLVRKGELIAKPVMHSSGETALRYYATKSSTTH